MELNNNNIRIAVIYYCYNRIEHTKKSLPEIFKYKNELPLYIFCDGSKNKQDNNVLLVREFVKKTCVEKDKTKVIFRNKNLGLAPNVINGVNQIFDDGYDAVIVLEDDCVPKKEFFNFMTSALNFYNGHNNVMHISGFGLPLKHKLIEDSYITPYPCSWGWGTWKDVWGKCNFEDQTFYNQILNDSYMKTQFDWAGKSFSNFLNMQINKKIDSWLIRWYAHIFKEKGVCIWAINSKLENIGFDGTGAHKVRFDRFNQKHIEMKNKFLFNKDLEFDLKLIKEFKQFFMGPKIIDKIKTIIYMLSGIILDKFTDKSKYYKT
jgi:hypothetical protein